MGNKYVLNQVLPELKELYSKSALVPFIGAGFSIPLSLPSWAELMGQLGEDMKYEKELFLELGSFQQLAGYVYCEDSKIWKHFLLNMSTAFNSVESNNKRKNSIQHQALSSLDFKIIYTTNYDMHIEKALEDVGKTPNVISTYEDFLMSRTKHHDCEILKFHGSLEEQESIILTENQYFERMELEGALDQRLRADALTNSFLFMGYSFSDPNIRYIFYKLHKLKQQIKSSSSTKDVESYSYIATFGMNDIHVKLLEQWDIKVIELDPGDKENSIAELLNSLK